MSTTLNPLDTENIRAQYEFQTALLDSLDLLDTFDGRLGVSGIDAAFHALPPIDSIQVSLRSPALRRKVEQGFDQLLLVPFSLPLHRLVDAWGQGLQRNARLLKLSGVAWERPVWVMDGYDHGELVYFPEHFDSRHGGRTKAQLLAADPSAGWQVLLTEGGLADLPGGGQGRTIGGRPQMEAGQPPWQYLEAFPPDEVGWTPETYIIAFLTMLEWAGRPLDAETASYLTAAYQPASGDVPRGYWHPLSFQAYLGRYHPGCGSPLTGARAAVKVL